MKIAVIFDFAKYKLTYFSYVIYFQYKLKNVSVIHSNLTLNLKQKIINKITNLTNSIRVAVYLSYRVCQNCFLLKVCSLFLYLTQK